MSISRHVDHFYVTLRERVLEAGIRTESVKMAEEAYCRMRTLLAQAQWEECMPNIEVALRDSSIALLKGFGITPSHRRLWAEVTDLPYKLMEILKGLFATPNATPTAN